MLSGTKARPAGLVASDITSWGLALPAPACALLFVPVPVVK